MTDIDKALWHTPSWLSVSVSGVGGSDSAVIDSRYKPARQRETQGGSTSGYLEPHFQGTVVL
jgi:hypothetical protein